MKKSQMTKVGVSIACFNAADHLEKCLKSVLNSKNINLFVCVVDDGSTDSTADIALGFPQASR